MSEAQSSAAQPDCTAKPADATPFLIAHRVHGAPAFDIAIRMCCPLCASEPAIEDIGPGCVECDSLGYWWMVHGRRAYPWWSKPLHCIAHEGWLAVPNDPWRDIPAMPDAIADHYPEPRAAAPSRPAFLASLLAKPRPTIHRRGL
jgi:hypothetical protein